MILSIRACAYQGVKNVRFSENFEDVLNEWTQAMSLFWRSPIYFLWNFKFKRSNGLWNTNEVNFKFLHTIRDIKIIILKKSVPSISAFLHFYNFYFLHNQEARLIRFLATSLNKKEVKTSHTQFFKCKWPPATCKSSSSLHELFDTSNKELTFET